jgi:hypothetical protein
MITDVNRRYRSIIRDRKTGTRGKQTMPPLTSILNRIADHVQPTNVSKLEARLTVAEAELQTKQAALNALLMTDEDSPAVTKAEDALTAAERRVLNLKSAIQAARQKVADEQAADSLREKEVAREKALAAATARHDAIVTLAKAAEVFAQAYRHVLKTNGDLLAHIPTNHDTVAAMSDRPTLETKIRMELVRLGVPWAIQWPYGAVSIPPMVGQAEGALSVVRNIVEKQ